jgi:hypothetical protein
MPRLETIYILSVNQRVKSAWSSLKHLCEFEQKETGGAFPSYWTLARKTKGGFIEFTEGGVSYEIYVLPVKGYTRKTNDTEGPVV